MIIKTSIPGLADSLVIPLQNKVNELNKEIDNLNSEINSKDLLISDQQTYITNQSEQINILNSEIEELNTVISDYIVDGTKFSYSSFPNGIPQRYLDYMYTQSDWSYMFQRANISGDIMISVPDTVNLVNRMFGYTNCDSVYINGNNRIFTNADFFGGTKADVIQLTDITLSYDYDGNYMTVFDTECNKLITNNVHIKGRPESILYRNSKLQKFEVNYDIISEVVHLGYAFYELDSLEVLPKLDTSKLGNFYHFILFCDNLKRIEEIDFTRCNQTSGGFNWAGINNCRYILIKNLGKHEDARRFDFSDRYKISETWGLNSEEVPDARQSLIDTFITYSFDRAAAGYQVSTIQLMNNIKSVFTDEEIAQITAKGYTLA